MSRKLATTRVRRTYADIADYIDCFYNRTRRHSHLAGVSPEQFEAASKRR